MKCSYCGEVIKNEAIKCRFCGEWLKKKISKNVRPLTPTSLLNKLLYAVLIGLILVAYSYIGFVGYQSYKDSKFFKSPTSLQRSGLDENILWNLVNDWETKQGYQSYIKDENLCNAASRLINDESLWSDKQWFKKIGLNSNFQYNNGFNSTINNYSEEAALNNWTSNNDTLKNLKDTYFQYSCIKCEKFKCFQVLANLSTSNTKNFVQQPNISPTKPSTNVQQPASQKVPVTIGNRTLYCDSVGANAVKEAGIRYTSYDSTSCSNTARDSCNLKCNQDMTCWDTCFNDMFNRSCKWEADTRQANFNSLVAQYCN